MKTREPKASPKPREINFQVKPGIFVATGAAAKTETLTGLARLRQQVDTHVEMAEKLLAENPNNLIPKERLRVESHLGVLKNIAASIIAAKGKEWVPTEAEVSRVQCRIDPGRLRLAV